MCDRSGELTFWQLHAPGLQRRSASEPLRQLLDPMDRNGDR
jgi:hypothetical protein